MKGIGRTIIWEQDVEELAQRWVRRHPGEAERENLSAAELADRLRRRSELARQHAGLPSAARITNARHWETHWKPEHAQRRLREAFRRLGWECLIAENTNVPRPTLAGASPDSENSIVFEKSAGEAVARQYREAGLYLPFEASEGLVLLMAEELYALAAEEMGWKSARPIVEEVAPKVFAQEVLGWPFCPWALDFL